MTANAPAHDAAAIAEIAKGLTEAQRAIMPHMSDGESVYPLARMIEELPGNIAVYRKALVGLLSMRLAEHGVLVDEDTGALKGSGTYLTPRGLAVRAHISQAKGE